MHIASSQVQEGPTQNVLVERPGKVDIEQLLVVDGQGHHPTRKMEVAEVVPVTQLSGCWAGM